MSVFPCFLPQFCPFQQQQQKLNLLAGKDRKSGKRKTIISTSTLVLLLFTTIFTSSTHLNAPGSQILISLWRAPTTANCLQLSGKLNLINYSSKSLHSTSSPSKSGHNCNCVCACPLPFQSLLCVFVQCKKSYPPSFKSNSIYFLPHLLPLSPVIYSPILQVCVVAVFLRCSCFCCGCSLCLFVLLLSLFVLFVCLRLHQPSKHSSPCFITVYSLIITRVVTSSSFVGFSKSSNSLQHFFLFNFSITAVTPTTTVQNDEQHQRGEHHLADGRGRGDGVPGADGRRHCRRSFTLAHQLSGNAALQSYLTDAGRNRARQQQRWRHLADAQRGAHANTKRHSPTAGAALTGATGAAQSSPSQSTTHARQCSTPKVGGPN